MTKITLGDEVQDSVTGFKGIAIARTTWLSGCDRYIVQPKGVDKAGKIYESNTFDEDSLIILKKKKVKEGQRVTGGPGLYGATVSKY